MVFNAEFAGVYLLIRGLFNDVFIGPGKTASNERMLNE
jgi:hypothetical protein